MVGRRLLGELGREHAARHRRRQRAENVVEPLEATVDDDTDGAAAVGGDLLDGRPCVYLAAQGDDLLLEGVDDRLVAAVEPAHDLAAALVARRAHPARPRPDVRRGQVVELAVELGVEERLPQLLDHSAAAVPLEPVAAAARRRACRAPWSAGSARRTPPAARARAGGASGKVRNSFGEVIEKSRPSP